uniref:Retrovirus-related Pol polyprotein from transposon TNT 1-94 n=1 Tax=Tanacetum cinerariifolium TaxID=118510 RepID=A0A6L2LKZ7_TANCI|nr:retrovirus-related Pol polyprotein from transposon TNT 1-94 [Tanacetum cinerariifolium]
MSYLIDSKEIDGGYVAFGKNPKGGKITEKCTIKTEAVNTACYVQNRVLVVKPHNKTLYELFHGRTPTLSFMRQFGCPFTITIDHLGKFYGKADKGSGPDWLFDIDALTRTINYEPIVAGIQSNGFAGTKASDNVGQTRKEIEPVNYYILLPLWTVDPPFSQNPKSSHDDRSKPSSGGGKKVDEDLKNENECKDQEKEDNVNNTNNVNTVSLTVYVAGTNENNKLPFDLNMPTLEDVSTFDFSKNDEDDGAMADMNNLDTTILVSPIPTTRIHKDHHLDQVFRNKKDERGIIIRNKARLVAQGYTQEEEIEYDEVFAPVVRIEAIKLFLAYASFKDFVVYQMDVKNAFIYGKIEKEVFTEVKTASIPMETQKPLLKDEDGEKEDVHMYRSMIGSLMYLTYSRPDIMFAVCACARYQVNPKVSHLYAVKRIFRKPKRKNTQVPQPSGPTESVADEAVHKELGDSLVRVATIASSLEAEQDSSAKKPWGILLLKLDKDLSRYEIDSLKRRIKKLEKRKSLGEDASKQERRIDDIDADDEITLVNDADNEMFDVDDLSGEEVFVAGQNDNVVEEVVNVAQVSTGATTITAEEITLAQTLEALKTSKHKVKGIVFQELGKSTTTTTISSKQLQDKGKGIIIKEPVKPKNKDQIRLDEEADLKLQAEFDEEERLTRESDEKEQKANIALIEI